MNNVSNSSRREALYQDKDVNTNRQNAVNKSNSVVLQSLLVNSGKKRAWETIRSSSSNKEYSGWGKPSTNTSSSSHNVSKLAESSSWVSGATKQNQVTSQTKLSTPTSNNSSNNQSSGWGKSSVNTSSSSQYDLTVSKASGWGSSFSQYKNVIHPKNVSKEESKIKDKLSSDINSVTNRKKVSSNKSISWFPGVEKIELDQLLIIEVNNLTFTKI